MTAQHRFYTDLAAWWPLLSPVEDYAEEAAEAARILRTAARPVREVLELGSGGGHNAAHLKAHFTLTLTDLSDAMLDVSRRLNPACAHVQGDMRTLRLDRTFDAVFVHDAVDYMVTVDDLRAAITTAFVHCAPGGLALFAPDHVAEGYDPGTEHGGTDAPDGRAIRYLEWSHPVTPGATIARTDYVLVTRTAGGAVETLHEVHTHGLFPEATWLALLAEAGFAAEAVLEETAEDRPPRTLFVARRPA